MYFLYVLKSENYNRTYIGITSDLEKRFKEHNRGKVISTKFYQPYIMIHKEKFLKKTDARKRELELKNNSHKKELLFKSINLS